MSLLLLLQSSGGLFALPWATSQMTPQRFICNADVASESGDQAIRTVVGPPVLVLLLLVLSTSLL